MDKDIPKKKKNAHEKNEGVVILIVDKLEFSTWSIKEDNKWQVIMQKTMNHNRNITVLNIYALNFIEYHFIKQKLQEMQREITRITQ